MKKIIHQKEDCISCEACVDTNSTHWEMDDQGLAHLKGATQVGENWELIITDDQAPINKEAADTCPVDIIHVKDIEGMDQPAQEIVNQTKQNPELLAETSPVPEHSLQPEPAPEPQPSRQPPTPEPAPEPPSEPKTIPQPNPEPTIASPPSSDTPKDTVVILASNSFTGSHFVDYILKNTDLNVIGISRSPEYNEVLLPYRYRQQPHGRFTFHQLDVNKDTDQILQIIEQAKPKYIVNYAAQGEVRNSWKWPEQWFETNCMGVVKIAQALVNKPWLEKYVTPSTPEVYGTTGENIVENHNYQPSTPYGASKLAGDLFLMTLHKRYNFPVVFTRAANLYGIHQQLYRIIPRTIIYLKKGQKIQLHGGGHAMRAFIHARDVADVTYKALTHGKPGEVYHVAPNGGLIKIRDLVKLICEKMGYSFEASTEEIGENFGQDAIFSLSSHKAQHELGWQPKISLDQGIEEMIPWIDDNWEVISQLPHEYIHKE